MQFDEFNAEDGGPDHSGINYGSDANGNPLNVYNGTTTDTHYSYDQLNVYAEEEMLNAMANFLSPMSPMNLALASASTTQGSTSTSTVNLPTSNSDLMISEPPSSDLQMGSTRSVSMGIYGTIDILGFRATIDNSGIVKGVSILLGLNNVTGYKNLQWVQKITTNAPLRKGLPTTYIDQKEGNSTPFYLIGEDYNALINKLGYDFTFYDNPHRSLLDFTGNSLHWNASLFLVGVIGNTYVPLFMINYGFIITNGFLNVISPTFSFPLPIPQTFNSYFHP